MGILVKTWLRNWGLSIRKFVGRGKRGAKTARLVQYLGGKGGGDYEKQKKIKQGGERRTKARIKGDFPLHLTKRRREVTCPYQEKDEEGSFASPEGRVIRRMMGEEESNWEENVNRSLREKKKGQSRGKIPH